MDAVARWLWFVVEWAAGPLFFILCFGVRRFCFFFFCCCFPFFLVALVGVGVVLVVDERFSPSEESLS